MADWISYANLALNLLLLPLLRMLLILNTSVAELRVQSMFRGEQISDLKMVISELRGQVTSATLAASHAATAAAAAAAAAAAHNRPQ